ncbi:MAG TPA: hypothetical protein VJZ68_00525 [Nitrososphaera sp.]|nr:hypothetical protein [Nitrososphaera sp.]
MNKNIMIAKIAGIVDAASADVAFAANPVPTCDLPSSRSWTR